MSENTEKKVAKVIDYHDPVINAGADDVVTYIGATRGANVKYGVVFPVMVDEEFLKERYNMTLLEVVQAGVRQISTRPNYDAAFGADGSVDHAKMQEIADGYKPGSRIAGPKASPEKAKVARKLAKATPTGMTAEEEAEVMEAIARINARRKAAEEA